LDTEHLNRSESCRSGRAWPYHIRLGLLSRPSGLVPCAPAWPSGKPSVKASRPAQN